MNNLVIDIGNTSVKYAIFDNGNMILHNRFMGHDLKLILTETAPYCPDRVLVCSTIHLNETQRNQLELMGNSYALLDHTIDIPIKNLYKTPETLGPDRLAAAIGAYCQVKSDVLIIDMGTAITYDFVNRKGEYLGGNISPGLQMRLQALHDYTSQLPLVEIEGNLPSLGEDTNTAIRCGVKDGIRYEIEGYIRKFFLKYHNLYIFFTGGDEIYFENEIKKRIFADNYLVLKGLNDILSYQS